MNGRVRTRGGGRKKAEVADPDLSAALDALIEPETRGDPESPLRWTTKSTRNLADELTTSGHPVSHSVVALMLKNAGYSLQSTRKTLEGAQHPDRDAQFRYLNSQVTGPYRVLIGKAVAEDLDAVAQAAGKGILRLPVASTVPLGKAIAALTELERNRTPKGGKLVITTE